MRAEMSGPARGHIQRGRGWSSLWGTILVRGVPKWAGGPHVDAPTGTVIGGVPYGAPILIRGVPKLAGGRMRTLPLGPSVELSVGPRSS